MNKQNVTLGTWTNHNHLYGTQLTGNIWYKDKHIADFDKDSDAKLTTVAINACQSINKKCPQSVAKQIEAMYKSLKLYQSHQTGTSGHYCYKCAEAINEVLNAIEGKE